MKERIQKIISKSGVVSRRKAEQLIISGRVRVNNNVAIIGQTADISKDIITIDKCKIFLEKKIYIILHKPTGYITSNFDPQSRPTVLDLVKVKERIFPVGRLDYNTSGLIILTNDGDFSNFISHPSNNIHKKYFVSITKPLKKIHQEIISNAPKIDDEKINPFQFDWVSKDRKNMTIKLHEGKNRIIRRIFSNYGYNITRLKRLEIGSLLLDDLEYGKWRYIDNIELKKILLKDN
ncbi:MAG: pseudouridine synthase [Chloroflexi bacterium]|nr:pseudouridine synthase [Chloroflexota bacterium]